MADSTPTGSDRPDRPPLVSVIVPVRNELANYRACLDSLFRQTMQNFEVIWVEGGSTDDCADRVRREYSRVIVVDTLEDCGFRRKCRIGAAHARGTYCVFTNADVEFEPGWLLGLVRILETDPTVGIVGPLIALYDRRDVVNEAGNAFHFSGLYGSRGLGEPRSSFRGVTEVGIISGCCFMMARSLWQQAGGFSEDFDACDTGFHSAAEDLDLCWRVRLMGFRIVINADSVMYHKYVKKPYIGPKLNATFFSYWIVLLRNYRWPSLALLSPFALLVIMLFYANAIAQGPTSLVPLWHTQRWVIRSWRDILAMRRKVQATRRVRDSRIVERMEHRLQVTPSPLMQAIFSILCAGYFRVFRALVRWLEI
jgi:GT2 family glycosyltransferase